jgi:hypothetical protein
MNVPSRIPSRELTVPFDASFVETEYSAPRVNASLRWAFFRK